jgi:hypothetical protein
MFGGRSRLHELANALRTYAATKRHFPRGTYPRDMPTERNGVPFPPNQRVSWMVELLPYLGQGEWRGLYDLLQTQAGKSWHGPENIIAASTLIPYFVDPKAPDKSWWVSYPGADGQVAATHFVGVAGVGLDAAEYAADDPAVAKKLGAFGYDRVTQVADVKDGPDRTIMMLQVPPLFKTPWLAGGGSTIRGVPEVESVKPFVCATYKGKRGTYAIMGDGKVRFLAETTSDKDFQALCTIAGAENVDVNAVAPEVPNPYAGRTELKTAPAAPPKTPAPPANPAPPPAAPMNPPQ